MSLNFDYHILVSHETLVKGHIKIMVQTYLQIIVHILQNWSYEAYIHNYTGRYLESHIRHS